MTTPITAVDAFTDPVPTPATDDPANQATFAEANQALANRTLYLKNLVDKIGNAAQYKITAPADAISSETFTLEALHEIHTGYSLASSTLVTVPSAGVYLVLFSGSLTTTDEVKPAPVGVEIMSGSSPVIRARFKGYRYTNNVDYSVPVLGSVLLHIGVPSTTPISVRAYGNGTLSPTSDRSRLVIVRVGDLPHDLPEPAPTAEPAPDTEPDPDDEDTGALGMWMPDAAPESPHASDDEFDAGSIDGQWSEGDPGGYVTFSIDTTKQMLKAVGTGNAATDQLAFLYQAIPDAEFAIYTRVMMLTAPVATDAGLFISAAAPTGTGDGPIRFVRVTRRAALFLANSAGFTDYDSPGGGSTNDGAALMPHYLRMRVNGTNYFADVSLDGVGWNTFASGALGFTPSHFGLAVSLFDAVSQTVRFPFFRCFSGAGTSAMDGSAIGRFV